MFPTQRTAQFHWPLEVAIYLAFCVVKTVIQIYTAVFSFFLRLVKERRFAALC